MARPLYLQYTHYNSIIIVVITLFYLRGAIAKDLI